MRQRKVLHIGKGNNPPGRYHIFVKRKIHQEGITIYIYENILKEQDSYRHTCKCSVLKIIKEVKPSGLHQAFLLLLLKLLQTKRLTEIFLSKKKK